jgi:hypothetical protein
VLYTCLHVVFSGWKLDKCIPSFDGVFFQLLFMQGPLGGKAGATPGYGHKLNEDW